MEDVLGLAIYAVSLVITGAAMHVVQRQTTSGQLCRNALVGIKTKATKSSDAAWLAGHRAAGPRMLAAARTGYVAGACTAVLAIVRALHGIDVLIALVVPNAGMALLLAFALHGTVLADRAARAADGG